MARPTEIRSGDTYTYTLSSSDYPASDGWTLKVTINNSATRTVIAATTNANGKDYDVVLASGDTDDFTTAGTAQYIEAVETGEGSTLKRHTLYSGTVKILPNVAGASAAFDSRTHARTVLDAIEAAISGRATRGQLESTVIGDRQVQYLSPAELIKWRSFYKAEVAREEAAEKIANGLDAGNRMVVRFGTGSWR